MTEVWHSLKRSLNCKTKQSEVHDPKDQSGQHRNSSAQRRKQDMIDNSDTKNFTHGRSKSHLDQKPTSSSPKFRGSSSILNPITHEIVLDGSSGEIKVCPCCPYPQSNRDGEGMEDTHRSRTPNPTPRKTHLVDCCECNIFSSPRASVQKDSGDRHKSAEKPKCVDAVEVQDISEHSVIELHKEDSSWQIIEQICQTSSINSESKAGQFESVLKVQNMQKTFACFEEYRKMVKTNAEKLQKKHTRCLVDGNELLRFHGTTIACSLGISGSSSLCSSDQCGVCQILRHGFSPNKEFHGALGVFTTSTSAKAFDSIESSSDQKQSLRKSVIVCRVIAGRVHNPLGEIQEMADSGFDSLAGKISDSDIEELYILNPRALLPCFVVIYKS